MTEIKIHPIHLLEKSAGLQKEGYQKYIDPLKQQTQGKCSRCSVFYTVVTFAKSGDYCNYIVCDCCGAWMSLDNENEFYYPPPSTTDKKKEIKEYLRFRIMRNIWLCDTAEEYEKSLYPKHIEMLREWGITDLKEWFYKQKYPEIFG